MTSHDHPADRHGQDDGPRGELHYLRRGHWVFMAFLAIAAVFLLSEHRAHVLGALPYLFLLACPLMHIFMHGGHGGHGGHSHDLDVAPPARDAEKDGKEWT